MGKLKKSAEDIKGDWEALRNQWAKTSELWKDSTQAGFEKTHIEPIGPTIQAALKQIERLDALIDQARRELR